MQQVNYTQDQEAATAAFVAFMCSDDTEFVISGAAGVGKTTLLKRLINMKEHVKMAKLMGVEPLTEWHLTATTNKAAEVLQVATGMEASTVHSFLGFQLRTNYTNGKTTLARKGGYDVKEKILLVIDECSMIDSDLYKLIHESTYKCKILYIGDHCQLAPVMEELSPVFINIPRQELNQVVRSQGTPAITALCAQLRQTVETGVFKPMLEVPGTIDYLSGPGAESEIQRIFRSPDADARILCYTNNKVIGFNQYLRDFRGLPPKYQVGENVVSAAATKLSDSMVRVEENIHIEEVGDTIDYEIKGTNKIVIPAYPVSYYRGTIYVPEQPYLVDQLLKALAKQKDWVKFYRIKEEIGDLRPRDACTVYKAQGSTYETVVVDLTDIGTCTNASQAARMLYVACSRPTNRIVFIGQLPKRFLGE